MTFDRRSFLGAAALSGASALAAVYGPRPAAAQVAEAGEPGSSAPSAGRPPDGFPRQDPALVQRVVGASHRDIDTVRELVTRAPELAKASWDWGFGDWESALGAASHTGRREIAELLLAHGARPNLFSAAMLGQLPVVRALVEASPGIQATPGPHGIPLLAHARAGGEPAAAVVEYLERVGGADRRPEGVPLSEAERARYLGAYRFGTGAEDLFEVAVGSRGLMLGQPAGAGRALVYLGEHSFHPEGAPSVRVRFEDAGDEAAALAIYAPDLVVRASRVG